MIRVIILINVYFIEYLWHHFLCQRSLQSVFYLPRFLLSYRIRTMNDDNPVNFTNKTKFMKAWSVGLVMVWNMAVIRPDASPTALLLPPGRSHPLLCLLNFLCCICSLDRHSALMGPEKRQKVPTDGSVKYLQGSAKEWSLGCVKRAPDARGSQDTGITQPGNHSLASPCSVGYQKNAFGHPCHILNNFWIVQR